jgi:hypothetical protein
MPDLNITRREDESFLDFQNRAATERALHCQKLAAARLSTLADILRSESYDLLTIINFNGTEDESDGRTGTYVVNVRMKWGSRRTDEPYWATVVDGKYDHILFTARPRAVLHALAREADVDANEARFTVDAAARVLHIDPDTEGGSS